jgi:hypothetical protein
MGSFVVVDAVAYGSKLLARKKFHSYNSRMKAKTEGDLEFVEVLRVERGRARGKTSSVGRGLKVAGTAGVN